MNEQTFCLSDPASPVDVTVGLTERGHVPYVRLGYPNLVPPHNEGPMLVLYDDDAKKLAAALVAVEERDV